MSKYQFYQNEIVRNEETGRFNVSVSSSDPNEVLLKNDEDRISLYRSFTENDVSYLWYITDKRDYIFVTKKEGKFLYDFMEFSSE